MTDEQVEEICSAILKSVSFHHADSLEHVLGPCREDFSFASAVNRIADALGRIADALENRE